MMKFQPGDCCIFTLRNTLEFLVKKEKTYWLVRSSSRTLPDGFDAATFPNMLELQCTSFRKRPEFNKKAPSKRK